MESRDSGKSCPLSDSRRRSSMKHIWGRTHRSRPPTMLRPNPLLQTGRSGTAATSKPSQKTVPRTEMLAVRPAGEPPFRGRRNSIARCLASVHGPRLESSDSQLLTATGSQAHPPSHGMTRRFLHNIKASPPHDARRALLPGSGRLDSMAPTRLPGLLLAITVPERAVKHTPQRCNMPGWAAPETRLCDWSAGQVNRLAIALGRAISQHWHPGEPVRDPKRWNSLPLPPHSLRSNPFATCHLTSNPTTTQSSVAGEEAINARRNSRPGCEPSRRPCRCP